MFVIVGWLVALGCIFGVYIVHGGNIGVILKALPFEMVTIMGAAIGAFIANNQPKVLKASMAGFAQCFKGSKYTKARYMELMALLYDILQKARKEGLMSIEKRRREPARLAAVQEVRGHRPRPPRDRVHHRLPAHDGVGQSERARDRVADGQRDRHPPSRGTFGGAALQRLAGGLPAFGIVAAVLGVVNTMGSVGQPPAVLGGMIGSALVGTFLGILLAYGFFEPLAGLLEQKVDEGSKELQCIKTTLLASMQGYAPQVAVEFGRKVLYSTERPTFAELEGHVKGKK
jgi:chemotaxis protein MotA